MNNSSRSAALDDTGAAQNPGIPSYGNAVVVGEVVGAVVLMFALLFGLVYWQLRQNRDNEPKRVASETKKKLLWSERKKPQRHCPEQRDPVELLEAGQFHEADGFPKAIPTSGLKEIDGCAKHELEHHSIYEMDGETRSRSMPWF